MTEEDQNNIIQMNFMEDKEVSRRSFLKILGAGTGALAFSGSIISSFVGDKVVETVKQETRSRLNIDIRTDDPENPDHLDVWIREDLVGEESEENL